MTDHTDLDDPDIDGGPQILWGRVLVLLLALALAFWLGTTFGGDAGAQTRISDQQAEIAQQQARIAELEAEVAALAAGDDRPDDDTAVSGVQVDADDAEPAPSAAPEQPDDEPAPDAEPDADAEPPADAEDRAEPGEEYVVQSGDSLASIAQERYGDPSLWREIARANGLSAPFDLTIGDTLIVPPRP